MELNFHISEPLKLKYGIRINAQCVRYCEQAHETPMAWTLS